MTNNSIKSLALLLFTSPLCSIVLSADSPLQEIKERWFQIELIVFERTDLKDLNAEQWPETIIPIEIDSALDFLSPIPPFKNSASSVELIPELLSPVTEVIDNNSPTNFIPLEASELPYLPLKESFFQMQEQRNSIARSSNYHLLKHIAWRQPAFGAKDSVAIRILAGKDFSDDFNIDGSEKQTTTFSPITEDSIKSDLQLSNEDLDATSKIVAKDDDFLFDFEKAMDSVDLADLGPPPVTGLDEFKAALPHVWELDGLIEITLRRYLHINLQLVLKKPQQKLVSVEKYSDFVTTEPSLLNQITQTGIGLQWNTEAPATGFKLPQDDSTQTLKIEYLQPYALIQKRRVRSKEVHYFDHPLMGVLVLITAYDHQPEIETETGK